MRCLLLALFFLCQPWPLMAQFEPYSTTVPMDYSDPYGTGVPMPDYDAAMAQTLATLNHNLQAIDDMGWTATKNHLYGFRGNTYTVTVILSRLKPWYNLSGKIERTVGGTHYVNSLETSTTLSGVLEVPAKWPIEYGDEITVSYFGGNDQLGSGSYHFYVGKSDGFTKDSWTMPSIKKFIKNQNAETAARYAASSAAAAAYLNKSSSGSTTSYRSTPQRCFACNGTGICPVCKGSGISQAPTYGLNIPPQHCTYCNGTGKCPKCH